MAGGHRGVAAGRKLVTGTTRARDKAERARHCFDAMLDYEELGGIFAWGMIDHFSWLQGFASRRAMLPAQNRSAP
jgi:endo-1,4-beta-xylanase